MAEKIIKEKVSAGAKTEKIEEIEPGSFKIRVQAPPEKGKANARVSEMLAKYFNIPRSKVFLMSGATYKEKTFSVEI